MLSPATIAIVKATAPVLQEHGETLTRHFYQRMFRENPEVAPFFNPAHQTAGTQQRALAGAICAYAANIDNLGALGGAVELIAQKHASLQIQPEHYPIVGQNLLASIREVLDAAATEEIINAWAEAYGFLANILISREREIYQEHGAAPNGWVGFKSFRVLRKERESDVITSFYLIPADGSPAPAHKPGQYLTVRVMGPCGHSTMRNYSLSDRPGQPWLRISVKREMAPDASIPDGFVSYFMHEQVKVGEVLEVGPPCGEFVLDTAAPATRPLVFISAGVGITPVLSMLQAALEDTPERRITFIHGSQNSRTHAFREAVNALATQHPQLSVHYRYSAATAEEADAVPATRGTLNSAYVGSLLPNLEADFYFCGPKPFMVALYHQLQDLGVPEAQLHFEFFGPRQDLSRPVPAAA